MLKRALGEIRTPDPRIRSPVHCPLCYKGLRASEVRPVRRVLSTGELTLPDGRPSISPGRHRPGLASNPRVSARAGHTLCGLAPGEVYQAGPSPGSLVGSYPTVSPLPQPRGHAAGDPKAVCRYSRRPRGSAAVCSLLHWLAGFPGLPLATTLPCGARTFLDTSWWRGRLAVLLACRRLELNQR